MARDPKTYQAPTDRELATILAALRYYQATLDRGERVPDDIESIADNEGEFAPLNADEIDDLCMRLNTI